MYFKWVLFKINGKLIEQNADVFDDVTCAARVDKRDIRCRFTNTNVIENVTRCYVVI